MSRQEGVIQFNLSHQATEAVQYAELAGLIAWQECMHTLGLIGQDPARYEGLAYGNISHRLGDKEFLISGTQTGGTVPLTAAHFAHIEHCDVNNNYVQSRGPIKPSSECMSHAAIYANNPASMAVIHVHSPAIWQHYERLGLASTAATIDYGTPEMAHAIADCIQQAGQPSHACIAMLGHEDGIICFANKLDDAGQHLLRLYEQACTQ